ncbi:MAG TPA: hypothetical protein VMN38_05765 [Sphingomicrobium sp.]|nr:hypothetical protein [Sphingomicrobium sp.]
MRKLIATAMLATGALSISGCVVPDLSAVMTPPGSQPAPQRAVLADLKVDGDKLAPSTIYGNGTPMVTVCVRNDTTWNKGIGRAGGKWYQADPGGTACLNGVPPGPGQSFDLYKAKAFGVMTKMGSRTVDLTGHEGGTITYAWSGS